MLPGIRAGKMKTYSPGISNNHGPDLEQTNTDCVALSFLKFGPAESQTPDSLYQSVRHRGQKKPELIGPPVMATRPVGKHVQLLFFYPIFHLAACAVDLRRINSRDHPLCW